MCKKMTTRTRAALTLVAVAMAIVGLTTTSASASADALLKVDFNSSQDGGGDSTTEGDPGLSAAAHNQEGWLSYHANHEVIAEFTTADYGGITVTPDWPNTTDNRARQSIDRGSGNDSNWDDAAGDLNLVTDFIGIDTRTGNGGNGNWDGTTGTPTYMTLALGGLAAGSYDWISFHHDTEHVFGPFAVWLSTDGGATFLQLDDGIMTDSTAGGSPDSGATEAGPDAYSLSSTYHTSFRADGVNDVVFRFAPYSETNVHRQIWGMNGFELSGGAGRPKARSESPTSGDMLETTWTTLTWSAGDFAASHDVYIGTNFDDVNNGAADTFVGNQGADMLIVGFAGFPVPDGLVPGTTYYWRIDEVNDANAASPWKGDIWSFWIQPKTAYNPDPADGAEFVDPDATFSWAGGFAAKLHTVYMGTNFDDVNDAEGGAPSGDASYSPGTLESEKVYYWRVDEFDPPTTYKGDIWSFTTPGAVGNSQPVNGAVDVSIVATLSWTPADTAASSDLYFGTDADAVKSATTASPEYAGNKALGSESYDPGKLALDTDYYWRVDAVYADKTVKGQAWSFTTAAFVGIDDFEAYNDVEMPDPNSNIIFNSWIDGFGATTNGALVGNDLPPYAEQSTVHGGAQSMPYFYDNANKTSEATLTLVYPRDWTDEGVTKLSLWFRGGPGNAADRLFVALNGNAVVYHDDPAATQIAGWTEWVIDLAAFGVDLANVNTITIGIGTKGSPAAGGVGTMYFDDIRLIR